MSRLTIATILMSSILTTGFCNATVEQINPDDTYNVGPGGHVE